MQAMARSGRRGARFPLGKRPCAFPPARGPARRAERRHSAAGRPPCRRTRSARGGADPGGGRLRAATAGQPGEHRAGVVHSAGPAWWCGGASGHLLHLIHYEMGGRCGWGGRDRGGRAAPEAVLRAAGAPSAAPPRAARNAPGTPTPAAGRAPRGVLRCTAARPGVSWSCRGRVRRAGERWARAEEAGAARTGRPPRGRPRRRRIGAGRGGPGGRPPEPVAAALHTDRDASAVPQHVLR